MKKPISPLRKGDQTTGFSSFSPLIGRMRDFHFHFQYCERSKSSSGNMQE